MRITGYYLLLFFAGFTAYGQHYIFTLDNKQWEPGDFPDGIHKVSAYEYKISKRGKVKRDSTQLYWQQYDANTRKITGRHYSTMYTITSNDDVFSERSYYTFEKIYSPTGKIVKRIEIDEEGDDEHYVPDHQRHDDYYYDRDDNLVKEISANRFIYLEMKNEKDTLFYIDRGQPTIIDYSYNFGKLTEVYKTKDSLIHILRDIKTEIKKECNGCEPRHIERAYEYNSQGQKKAFINYNRNGLVSATFSYEYDAQGRPIKENNYSDVVTYEYTDNGSVKTVTNKNSSDYGPAKEIVVYNTDGYVTSKCYSYKDGTEECDYYEYTYEDDKVTLMVLTNCNGEKIQSFYRYNRYGLLIEEMYMFESKTTYLVRYYYN